MKSRTKTTRVTRRTFLAGATAAASAVAMAGARPAAAAALDGKEIRVLTWSDPTGQAAVNNILKPFMKETGARIIPDLTGATSQMVAKIKASAARPQYDLVILSGVGAVQLAQEGLLEKPDAAKLPNLKDVVERYRTGADGYGVGYFLWNDGMLYSTADFPAAPRSYETLWDPANKDRIVLPPGENVEAMELTLVAIKLAGGDIRHPDAGFEMLAKLRPNVVALASDPAQIAELFRSKAVTAGGVYSPLVFPDYIKNPDYALGATLNLDEGFFTDLQFMVMPKGHPGDADAVHALIDFALSPSVQAAMAEEVWYGPINGKVTLPESVRNSPYIPTAAMVAEKSNEVDKAYLASVRDEWIRRYNEALNG